jgi:hypothetical protein
MIHGLNYSRWSRLVCLLTAAAAAVLALAVAASARAATINVNPVSGSNSGNGTAASPLKTLGKALSLAQSGDTVELAAGGYGPGGNGEAIPANGLLVRSGVTVEGATDNGFPVSTLLGQGSGAALRLAGSATIRNLFIGGGQGFAVGVFARQGMQQLSNLDFGVTGATASIGGVPLNGGIFLRGTANATFASGAQQANSTGSTISVNGGTGISVNENARLTMNGGEITGGSQANCNTGTTGIALGQSAQATLNLVATPGLQNIAGSALVLDASSKATLNSTLIQRRVTPGCLPRPSVNVGDDAALTLNQSALSELLQGASTGLGTGIETRSSAPIALTGSDISGYQRGIDAVGNTGDVTLNRSGVSNCEFGIDATFSNGNTTLNGSFVDGDPSFQDQTGIIAPTLRMRGSDVSGNRTGILITGDGADLGTLLDPGNNTLRGDIDTAVRVEDGVPSAFILAIGNTWNPNTQGTDAAGHYTTPLSVDGTSPLANGQNFNVGQFNPSPNVAILLLGFGTARVSPRSLHAQADVPFHLTVSWTHPVSWRQLKSIQLRLSRASGVVGTVTIWPRTGRLDSAGAVSLLPGASRVTSAGKTTTARLSLRLARSLAGRTLHVAVSATDVHGHGQVQPRAAVIHVTVWRRSL